MIMKPTDSQLALAKFKGVLVAPSDSQRVVAAKLKGALSADMMDEAATLSTTDNQQKMARQLGIADLSPNMAVASSQIESELVARNDAAILKFRFAPGMLVEFVGGPTTHGHYWNKGDVFVVSSVKQDAGKVFFKKTTGMSAYASLLRPVKQGTERPTRRRRILAARSRAARS